MPLEVQNIDLPLNRGLSDGEDDLLVNPPHFRVANNVEYRKRGALSKRPAYEFLTATAGNQPVIFNYNGHLAVLTDTALSIYDSAAGSFRSVSLGAFTKPAPVTVDRITFGQSGVEYSCHVENNGYSYYVWSEPVPTEFRWATKVAIYNSEGGQVLAPTTVAHSGSGDAQLMATQILKCGDYVVVAGISDEDFSLQVAVFNSTTPLSAPNVSSPASNIFDFDMDSNGTADTFYMVTQGRGTAAGAYGDTNGVVATITAGVPGYVTTLLGTTGGGGLMGANGVFDGGLCIREDTDNTNLWIAGSSSRHENIYAYSTSLAFAGASAMATVHTYATNDYKGHHGVVNATQTVTTTWNVNTTPRIWKGCFVRDGVSGDHTLFWQGFWTEGASGTTGPVTAPVDHELGVRWRDIDSTATPSGSVGTAYNCGLATKGWRDSTSGKQYVPVVFNPIRADAVSQFRSGYLCFRDGEELVPTSRFLVDDAARSYDLVGAGASNTMGLVNLTRHTGTVVPYLANTQSLCKPDTTSTGAKRFAFESFDRSFAGGAFLIGVTGNKDARVGHGQSLKRVAFNFDDSIRPQAVAVRDSVAIANGNLLLYDGFFLSELSASFIPDAPLVTLTTPIAGPITGAYSVYVAWVFVDKEGREYRTSVSPAGSVGLINHSGSSTITVEVPKPPPSQLFSAERLSLEVYTSEVPDSSTLNEDTVVLHSTLDIGTVTAAFDAHVTVDIALLTNPVFNKLLPGSAGELQSEPTKPSQFITAASNRVWYIAADRAERAYFSRDTSQGLAIEFNLNQFVEMPDGQDIIAIASMDEQVVFFTTDHIYLLRGRLPNNLGRQASYELVRVESDGGCTNPKSICETHLGVFFEGSQGIKLLQRDYQVVFIGEAVEDEYTAGTLVDVSLFPDKNQVIFCAPQSILVYDYESRAWSQWLGDDVTDEDIADATVWNGKHVVIDVTGNVYQQTTSDYTDVVVGISTPWVKLAGIQGFKRVRELLLLGEHSIGDLSGDLQIQIYTDYDDAVPKETRIYPYENLSTNPTQIRLKPEYQKCQSIRFVITEIKETGGQGTEWNNSLTISAATLVVGKKKTGFKTPRTST